MIRYNKFFPEMTEERFERLRTDPYFAKFRENLISTARDKAQTPPPYVRFTELNLFNVNGDRKTFERVYAEYQNRIGMYAMSYLLTEDEFFLPHLADILWSFCDFETWSLQAHCNFEDTVARHEHIDLCAATDGFNIAQILYLLEDKLPERLTRRIHHELRVRIIDAFKNRQYHWYFTTQNNWAAVIASGVFGVYLYEATDEEIEAQLPVLRRMIDNYLLGFDDEGCCKEGYGYWNYGFSHFCEFAELLRAYTDGAEDLFKLDKVRAIAHFQENATIDEKHVIPFSDCGTAFSPSTSLTHFLKKEYPDVVVPEMKLNCSMADIRFIMWMDADIKCEKLEQRSHIFRENQWFIYKSTKYNVAVKAGSNGEFHNHNDVGSFVISKNNEITLTDLGAAKYCKQYFSNLRYTFPESSSRGHSVPIINGIYQNADNDPASRKAKVYTESETEYSFSMEQNYADETLVSLTRALVCEDDALVLTDTYAFSELPLHITERFVSRTAPVLLEEGRVQIGDSILVYDSEQLSVKLGGEPSSYRTDGVVDIFYTDLSPKNYGETMSFTFRFI